MRRVIQEVNQIDKCLNIFSDDELKYFCTYIDDTQTGILEFIYALQNTSALYNIRDMINFMSMINRNH